MLMNPPYTLGVCPDKKGQTTKGFVHESSRPFWETFCKGNHTIVM